jgi:GxxExxY protein
MPYGKKKIDLLYEDLTYKINGALYKVHNELGRFAREKQYVDLAQPKLEGLGLRCRREQRVGATGNILDLVVNDIIIIEFKAKPFLIKDDYYQLQRYLHSTGIKLGILVNFRAEYLKPHRVLKPNQ